MRTAVIVALCVVIFLLLVVLARIEHDTRSTPPRRHVHTSGMPVVRAPEPKPLPPQLDPRRLPRSRHRR